MKSLSEYIYESLSTERAKNAIADAIRQWVDDYVAYENGRTNSYISDPCEHYTDSCIKSLEQAYYKIPKSSQKKIIKDILTDRLSGWPAQLNIVKTNDKFWKDGIDKINAWFEEHK